MVSRSGSRDSSHEEEGEEYMHPLDLEKSTGFDASPYGRRPASLRRTTSRKSVEPRAPLARYLTDNQPAEFTHPLVHEQTSKDVLVNFEGPDDPYRAVNWPMKKKVITVLLYGLTTAGATWNSSIYSTATGHISSEYGVSPVVTTLGLTLFLLGFGTGPLLWAPLSEVYGRRVAVFTPYFISACFTFGVAASKDLQSIMITRFFAGFFGSAPVTNTGGVLGDLFTPAQRAAAMAGYSMAVVGGPLLSPIVGGAIIISGTSWRWTEYMTGALMLVILFFDVMFVDETYGNTLLVYKARRLRHESGNWALHAKSEEWDVSISELAHKYLVMPWKLGATPICFSVSLYSSFCYAIIYMSFAAFPIAYAEERGWNEVVSALPFLGVFFGCIAGAAVNVLNTPYYLKKMKANNGKPVPEARLPPMMLGSVLFPAGLFLFGWTSSKHIFWFPSVIGTFLIGFGFVMIFQCGLNYMIDTFTMNAASAVAVTTAMRSVLAGCFPLFTPAMFHNLGIDWAASLCAFIALALVPIPFLFYIYGKRLRAAGELSRPSVE